MARKCSHCGNFGNNSRTCSLGGHGGEVIMLCEAGNNNGGGGGGAGGGSTTSTSGLIRLFGVQVHVGAGGGAAASSMMKKSYSMDCLHLASATAAAGAPAGCSSLVSPSSSSSSSMLLSIDEGLERAAVATNGYLSDGPHGRVVQERKKGVPWSEEEHRQFLIGLEKLGKGDWRGISRSYVTTRTPTQVASHAQKFFLRQSSMGKKKRRSSLFDMVPIRETGAPRGSDQLSGGESTSTSLSLNVPRDDRPAAFDLNSAEEDEFSFSPASGGAAGTAGAGPSSSLHPSTAHGHGHHCSPLELELGMSLSATSIGT